MRLSDVAADIRSRFHDEIENPRYTNERIAEAVRTALNGIYLADGSGFTAGAEEAIGGLSALDLDVVLPARDYLRGVIVSESAKILDRLNVRGTRPEVAAQSAEDGRNV